MRFELLVHNAMRQMRDLPDEAKYDLALRIYDVLQYEDHRLARRYVELVKGVYKRDSAERKYAATIAAIWNVAKVILIKDEPYVSYLLTRFEKKQRDLVKYNVDVANGDRIVYRHHTKPELSLGPWRFRMNITTRDWMLNVVRRCKWLRHVPGWHRREADFRDWYVSLLDRVDLTSDGAYEQALRVLKCPEEVSGYREVRYPKMDKVRQTIESELSSSNKPQRHVEMKPLAAGLTAASQA
jgi:indolepyruvate ferredoxin oxidoreductase